MISVKLARKIIPAFVLSFPGVYASAKVAAPEVGILDMQRIILEVEEGKSAVAKLKKEIEEKKTVFLGQKAEIERMDQDLRSNSDLLSSEAKQKKQLAIQEKLASFQEAEMRFQGEIKQKEYEATQEIAAKAASIATKLAEQNHLTMVYDRNSSGLIYVANPLDLTDKVIAEYQGTSKNKLSKK